MEAVRCPLPLLGRFVRRSGKPRSRLCLGIAIAAFLVGSAVPGRALTSDSVLEISAAYRARDAAYARSNPEGLVASLGDTLTVSVGGRDRTLTKEQQIAAARYEVRAIPGRRIARRETTAVVRATGSGGKVVLAVSLVQEVDIADAGGTAAQVRDDLAFEDTWSLTPGGWRQTGRRQTGSSRTASGNPSAGTVAALSNMRRQVDMLRGFNAANSRSNCMTANQNQRYDYQTRQAYCSN